MHKRALLAFIHVRWNHVAQSAITPGTESVRSDRWVAASAQIEKASSVDK